MAGGFEAGWTDEAGATHTESYRTYAQAIQHFVRHQAGGPRFTTSATPTRRGSWTTECRRTWCDGSWGTSGPSTTLDLYTRRTDNSSRILDPLNDPAYDGDEHDPDDGSAPVSVPA